MAKRIEEGAPLYQQVEAALAADITAGLLVPGDQLPAEDGLIARFAVSRTTVRKAVENLVARGVVEIRRGKGTFVAPPRIVQDLTELTGFVEDMRALGRRPTARLLDQRPVPADALVAASLEVPVGTLVYRFARVRLADGVAVSFDETYLPLDLGRQVATHDLAVEPIFALLEQRYGLALVEAEYRMQAVVADARVAAALAVAVGSPIFRIERTSYCAGRRPVDHETLYYRGDLIKFVTRLSRRTPAAADMTTAVAADTATAVAADTAKAVSGT